MTAPMPGRHDAGGKTVIITSAHDWQSPIQLSAHHFARHLVRRGHRVCFLTTPISPLHRLMMRGDAGLERKTASWRAGGILDLNGRLLAYAPNTLLPPSRVPGLRSSAVLENWPHWTRPAVSKALASHGFGKPDLMVLDTPVLTPVWRALGEPRLVYRVADLNSDHPNVSDALKAAEAKIAERAEFVIYTSEMLEPYVAEIGARDSICVLNGVDCAHFSAVQSEPDDLAGLSHPRVIYVGTIAEWFDAQLVGELAKRLPHISFVLIGPLVGKAPTLPDRANVRYLGPKPYAQVPGYLQHSDVGIIPFRLGADSGFVDAINPLKLYEYMASGLPVMASRTAHLARQGGPAVLYKQADEAVESLTRMTSVPKAGSILRATAAEWDWSKRFAQLTTRLDL
jgi:glycosyltransferase involved in cell wall biosynthesis